MMNITWSESSLAQLEAIHAYIALNSPQYATAVLQRIRDRVTKIPLQPMAGEVVPEFNVPQIRQVIASPYRILYRISAEEIEILGVLHGSQQSPFE